MSFCQVNWPQYCVCLLSCIVHVISNICASPNMTSQTVCSVKGLLYLPLIISWSLVTTGVMTLDGSPIQPVGMRMCATVLAVGWVRCVSVWAALGTEDMTGRWVKSTMQHNATSPPRRKTWWCLIMCNVLLPCTPTHTPNSTVQNP